MVRPAPQPPPQVGRFTVVPISLAPIAGVHAGTGRHLTTEPLVDPSSVPGSGLLRFAKANVAVTALLFQLNDASGIAPVVPNWFGVAVPDGYVDFTNAHIYFHPIPAQAGYQDSDYPTKAGKWPQLFYYMDLLGYQLDGAKRNQVVIMPFLTSAAADTGVFADHWHDIVTNLLRMSRYAIVGDGKTVNLDRMIVSSHSVGIVYSAAFRSKAVGLTAALKEVWDFDGLFSSAGNLSKDLHSTGDYTVIKYQQQDPGDSASIYLPLSRWANAPAPPKTALDVHHAIRDYMLRHGASISTVG
jgi:hypothetical protein